MWPLNFRLHKARLHAILNTISCNMYIASCWASAAVQNPLWYVYSIKHQCSVYKKQGLISLCLIHGLIILVF